MRRRRFTRPLKGNLHGGRKSPQVSISLEHDLLEAINARAQAGGRSVSAEARALIVRGLLAEWMGPQERARTETKLSGKLAPADGLPLFAKTG
jgi:plasmid stability protein